jgi:hypothetical protein
VSGEGGVAIVTAVVLFAAAELDGEDIERAVPVLAAGLRVETYPVDLWPAMQWLRHKPWLYAGCAQPAYRCMAMVV